MQTAADPKIMAELEGDQYADIFGTMDSEQRGRYLVENPWVAQRLLELNQSQGGMRICRVW